MVIFVDVVLDVSDFALKGSDLGLENKDIACDSFTLQTFNSVNRFVQLLLYLNVVLLEVFDLVLHARDRDRVVARTRTSRYFSDDLIRSTWVVKSLRVFAVVVPVVVAVVGAVVVVEIWIIAFISMNSAIVTLLRRIVFTI